MTTIAFTEAYDARPTIRLVITLPAFLPAFLRRRAERRLFACLSRLSPHLIRDVGFDPDEVHAALAGSWDGLGRGRDRRC